MKSLNDTHVLGIGNGYGRNYIYKFDFEKMVYNSFPVIMPTEMFERWEIRQSKFTKANSVNDFGIIYLSSCRNGINETSFINDLGDLKGCLSDTF